MASTVQSTEYRVVEAVTMLDLNLPILVKISFGKYSPYYKAIEPYHDPEPTIRLELLEGPEPGPAVAILIIIGMSKRCGLLI